MKHFPIHILLFATIIILLGCDSKQESEMHSDSHRSLDTSISAQHQSINFYNDSIMVDQNNVPLDEEQFYFPLKLFPVKEYYYARDSGGVQMFETRIVEGKKDTFSVDWYSKHLYAMNEPLLFNENSEKEIYRFTWLRTFDHPIAIRIENRGKNYTLILKICDGAGGYDPGKLVINKSKSISESTWFKFKDKLEQANFWHLQPGRASFGTDGSEWILEGVRLNKYHVVTVWSPEGGKFYEACRYLLRLTDLNIPEDKIY